MTALLVAEGLRKIYRRAQDDLLVLAECDLALAEGEAVAVIGPSGSLGLPLNG